MNDRLFDPGEPEIPLFKPPQRRALPARGVALDARFANEYPPEWTQCQACDGVGTPPVLDIDLVATMDVPERDVTGVQAPGSLVTARVEHRSTGLVGEGVAPRALAARNHALNDLFAKLRLVRPCPECLGTGSLKARVRREAGHRCVRCHHPYMPQEDALMLGATPSGLTLCPECGCANDPNCGTCRGDGWIWTPWSRCDEQCTHYGGEADVRFRDPDGDAWDSGVDAEHAGDFVRDGLIVEAEWRILTVHHLDGDKSNCRWWNLAALDQRCHLEIQAKVVMERVYPFEHSEWFKPFAAGYYAFVYLCKTCGRDMTWQRPPYEACPPLECPGIPLDRLANMRGVAGYPHVCEPGFEVTREEAIEHMDFLLGLERVV